MSIFLRTIIAMLLACSFATVSMTQGDGRGVLVNQERSLDGYTLIAPQFNDKVYLIDNDGRVVNEWKIGSLTREAHLLDNGNVMVLRAPREELDTSLISLGYSGDGAVSEHTWEGEMVWEYVFRDPRRRQHHGIDILPNGNILALVWDYHLLDEALAKGMDPANAEAIASDGSVSILPDTIVEIDPSSGAVVWEWRAWDHLTQDIVSDLSNYGSPSARPERIDINYHQYTAKGIPIDWSAGPADWHHSNMVNYNPGTGPNRYECAAIRRILDH